MSTIELHLKLEDYRVNIFVVIKSRFNLLELQFYGVNLFTALLADFFTLNGNGYKNKPNMR